MKEENPSEARQRGSKFASQNQVARASYAKENTNPSKPRSASTWGSNIVKGFTAEKKSKAQTAVPTKKVPLANSDVANKKNPSGPLQGRAKRSLISDLAHSVNPTQVHPQELCSHRAKPSAGSHDLFLELESLRNLLRESKERENELQVELSRCRKSPRVLELEAELVKKKNEMEDLVRRVDFLEAEKKSLTEQLVLVKSDSERQEAQEGSAVQPFPNLEMEVLKLRRLNKELQLQKRDLACRLSSMESQLATNEKVSESESISKIKDEASLLRHTNEDLCKQVEGLQMSRLNEVEELVYLRWVNSCLRNELRNSCVTENPDSTSSPKEPASLRTCPSNDSLEFCTPKRLNIIKKFRKWPIVVEYSPSTHCLGNISDKTWLLSEEMRSPGRRHSLSATKSCADSSVTSKRRQSDSYMCPKDIEKEETELLTQNYDLKNVSRTHLFVNCQESNRITASSDVERRALRIPNPPPRPSGVISSGPREGGSAKVSPPPPPPPPPPPKFSMGHTSGAVQRAPQVVEFYHSLMKRDSRKDSSNGGIYDVPDVANARSSMIGEIENRSSHLLAIKADVETQGEFVNSLIREVNDAAYQDIEDVVAFVKWLDDELCYLVDERAVLKHFSWPEKKADALREAAFSYRDLKKLESEVSYYEDDPRVPCDLALKKMVTLSEKMEHAVYNLLRSKEQLMRRFKEFNIPTDWMLDNGILSRIKFGSMKLAKKYMKRVAMELHSRGASEKDPAMDYMLLQGVRFAFRIHQFAGGFDAETMHTFEELRNLGHVLNKM